MRYFYSLLFYLALPFLFLRLLWRSRNNSAYRQRWKERLGFTPYHLEKCIWIHAVSVGETIAAIPLIKALKAAYPALPILVTNMTPTGAARVKAAFNDQVLQAYIPYDLPDAFERFLKRVNPIIAVIMETEIWPNLFAVCQKNHVPIMIANARLSEKSARGYHLIASQTREMLNAVSHLASQGYADAERFKTLGLPPKKITVTGNLKFDLELAADLQARSIALRKTIGEARFIWIAASTHQGEEDIILKAHQLIREKIPHALLILVPRHPERFNAVALQCEQQSLQTVRRSQGGDCTSDTAVYLGDTMGEMMLMYAVSDVAFVAGSFVSIGGHNMLEPAALGKPILTGPYLFNFAEISEMLLKAEGMLKVNDANELAEKILTFFNDNDYRQQVGKNALKVIEANRGALTRQIDLIKNIIDTPRLSS